MRTSSDADQPDIDFNDQGVGFAVWIQSEGGVFHAFAARYSPAGGWETPERIDGGGGTGDAQYPQVVVDAGGNAIAIWVKFDGTRDNMWGARFAAGVGWGADEVIETDNGGSVYQGSIAGDAAGNAIAIWPQWNGTTYTIIENRYVVGSGWEGPGLVSPGVPSGVSRVGISMTYDGRAVVAWAMSDGVYGSIYAATYQPAAGWTTAAPIELSDSEAQDPTLAGDGVGDFIVTWTQYNGVNNVINASVFHFATGWDPDTTIASMAGFDLYSPQVAVAERGDAIVSFLVWDSAGGGWSGVYYLYAIAYRQFGGWDAAPTAIANETQNNTAQHRVAIDSWGHGVIVFERESTGWLSRPDIWAAAWDAAQGFYPAQRIETTNAGYAYVGDVESNENGQFVAAFTVSGTPTQIWYNWLTWADTTAPAVSIVSPMEAAVFDASPIRVTGTTEAGAHLVVNGLSVAVAENGSWWVDIPLTPGNNSIDAAATDDAGNLADFEVSVWYTDPATYIQANLSATEAQLAATRAQLTSTQAQLTTTQAQLSTAYASLNATKADLATTQAQLNSTSANLTTTKNEVGTANNNVASAQGTAMLGVILGLVGIVIGAVGIMIGMRSRRPDVVVTSPAPPAQPPK